MRLAHRPDKITVTRKSFDDVAETETVGVAATTTIATSVRSLVAPAGSFVDLVEPGPVDVHVDLIFLGLQDDGTFYAIKTGDILTDDVTGEVWIAQAPGRNHRDPSTFGGTPVNSHTEVEVAKTDWSG